VKWTIQVHWADRMRLYCTQRTRMQPLCWGHLRAGWADRMLQTDFLRPDAMPIRLEQALFLLMLPPHDTITNAYRALKGQTRLLLLEEWRRLAPPPPYYTFSFSLTPHPFMGLGKFMAGRIHQMRAQKIYLPTHPSWSRVDEPRHCPRCGEEEETFSHAILRRQSTSYHRERLLQGLSDVGPDSPLGSDKQLLLALANFIQATGTNYPPDMFPSVPPSPASMVFPSPPPSISKGLFSSSLPRPV